MAHRKLSDEQRAAHVLLPLLSGIAAGLRLTAQEVQRARASTTADAKRDWAEVLARAEGRREGAELMLREVARLARS
jgi:hypothetical protein